MPAVKRFMIVGTVGAFSFSVPDCRIGYRVQAASNMEEDGMSGWES
jgi:hypothetical protein